LDDKYTLKDEVNQETLLGHMKWEQEGIRILNYPCLIFQSAC
jgi:hypothetical protein